MPLTIRDARPADAGIIAEFNSRMSEETEGIPLDPGLIGPGVEAILADPAKGRYWVAEIDGELVGQIMTTLEWSDWRNGSIWWLQSVYVRQDHRRSGVFSALYRHVESLARETPGVVGIRLYVEKDNERAKATYDKLGFSMTGYQLMQALWSGHGATEGDD